MSFLVSKRVVPLRWTIACPRHGRVFYVLAITQPVSSQVPLDQLKWCRLDSRDPFIRIVEDVAIPDSIELSQPIRAIDIPIPIDCTLRTYGVKIRLFFR